MASQSINKYFSNPNINGETKAYLQLMKNKMIAKTSYGMKKDQDTAKKMQAFLNALKNTASAKEINSIKNYMDKELLNQLRDDLPPDIFRTFSRAEDTKGQPYDDIFEKDINTVLQKIAKTSNNKGQYYDGQKQATTAIMDDVSKKLLKDIKDIFDEDLIKEIQKNIKTKSSKTEEDTSSLFTLPAARAQKSDITTIEITEALKPEYAKIVDLFKGYRFSIKNYSGASVSGNGITVELGSSNPLKAFIGVLTSFNQSQSVAIKAFFASAASYSREQDDELADAIFSLRLYYELTGAGLLVDGKRISEVDFIIINNPDGRIIVKSTKELLNSIFTTDVGIKYAKGNDNPYKVIKRTIPFN